MCENTILGKYNGKSDLSTENTKVPLRICFHSPNCIVWSANVRRGFPGILYSKHFSRFTEKASHLSDFLVVGNFLWLWPFYNSDFSDFFRFLRMDFFDLIIELSFFKLISLIYFQISFSYSITSLIRLYIWLFDYISYSIIYLIVWLFVDY